tara:strand:+ start:761 stop:991 length:231 start_codon:yes stop_codon:yes gene_type:complete
MKMMKKRVKAKAKPKAKAPMKVKGVSMAGLKPRQAMAMKRHSVHHTGKHIRMMVTAMKKGATFSQSHKMAVKKVGK